MHQLRYHKRALKTLKQIPSQQAVQIVAAADVLASTLDPTTHPGVKIMRGQWKGSRRLRVGPYRIIFEVLPDDAEGEIVIIFVTSIGSRRDVY